MPNPLSEPNLKGPSPGSSLKSFPKRIRRHWCVLHRPTRPRQPDPRLTTRQHDFRYFSSLTTTQGPLSWDEMKAMWKDEQLTPDSVVWKGEDNRS